MAITVVGSSTSGGDGSPRTPAAPAGMQAGDLLIAFHTVVAGGTPESMGTPTGGATWTQLGSTLEIGTGANLSITKVWWKIAGGSEPGSYSFTQEGGVDATVAVVALRGHKAGSTPVIATSSTGTSVGTVGTPSTTPHNENDFELRWMTVHRGMGWTPTITNPGGFSQVTAVNSTNWSYSRVISRQLSSSSATGVHNFTVSPTATRGIGVTVNIEAFDSDTDPVGVSVAGTFGATVNAPVPAGTLDGDILISHVTSNSNTSLTPPSGWDLVRATDMGGGTWVWTYTRIASSEPASYTWGFVPDHWNYVTTHAWRGFYGVTDSAVSFSPDSTATSQTFPQLQALTNDVLLAFGYNWSNTTQSFSPAGLTERTQQARSAISGSQRITSDGPTTAYTVTAAVAGKMAATSVLLSKNPPPTQDLDTEADPLVLELEIDPATAEADVVTSGNALDLELEHGAASATADVVGSALALDLTASLEEADAVVETSTEAATLPLEIDFEAASAGAQYETEGFELGLGVEYDEAGAQIDSVSVGSVLGLDLEYGPVSTGLDTSTSGADFELEIDFGDPDLSGTVFTAANTLDFILGFTPGTAAGQYEADADALNLDLELSEAHAGAQFDTEAGELALELEFPDALAGNQQVTEASALSLGLEFDPADASWGQYTESDGALVLELGLSEAVTDAEYMVSADPYVLTVDFGQALAQGDLSVTSDGLILDLNFGSPRFQVRIEDLVTVSITNTVIGSLAVVTHIPSLSVSTAIDSPVISTAMPDASASTALPPAEAPATALPSAGTVTSVPSMNIPPTQLPSTASTTQLPSMVVVVELDEELL